MPPIIVREIGDRSVHLARELIARGTLGETPEVGWQHFAPVCAHLPRAALIGEEHHGVGILVDAPEQRE
jgi:hypothetical protein